jgi:hypothetical protein
VGGVASASVLLCAVRCALMLCFWFIARCGLYVSCIFWVSFASLIRRFDDRFYLSLNVLGTSVPHIHPCHPRSKADSDFARTLHS